MATKRFVRYGTKGETATEEHGRTQTEIHPHKHEVKYRDKEGNIRDYVYNYGKIQSKPTETIKRMRNR